VTSGSCSPAEQYLNVWHRRHPDATRVFADMRDATGRTSYQRLADVVISQRVILDVACGAGGLLALLHRPTAPRVLLGVDLCEPELTTAARVAPAANLMGARAQALPFAAQSIDVILCHMALMLMDAPDTILRECRRVLRPGATIATITNSLSAPDGVMRTILLGLRDSLRAGDSSRLPPTLGDTRTHGAAALAALMTSCFVDVTVQEFRVGQTLPRDALWPFMVQSIYGLDAIADVEGTRLLSAMDLPDLVTWEVPMVQIQASVPLT
jgi:ubiquinone/menaquinone biosynthesis C-methylase UbiE